MSRSDGSAGIELFARAMLNELVANEHKGGWRGHSDRYHRRELEHHAHKLAACASVGSPPERILELAADVANCAWMWADDLRALREEVLLRRSREPDYVSLPAAAWLLVSRHALRHALHHALRRTGAIVRPLAMGGRSSPR